MPSLPELQGQFAAALEDATRAGAAAGLFRGPPGRAGSRLAIYRRNVFGNCAKALESAYPIARKIVGHDFFDALGHAYVRKHPSSSADLSQYGASFPAFLEQFPPVGDLPYLPDVARMEWHAHRAHFARDPSTFRPAGPDGIAADIRLKLSPPCGLLASPWPLARIWRIHQDDYEGAFDIDLASGPDRVLVHRPRWRAEVVSLAAGDFRFLQSIRQGAPLGAALEAGASDVDFDPSTVLARWIAARVLESPV